MRNFALNNHTLGMTLLAGAFVLALSAPLHAQILGGGGALAGQIHSTMGQVGPVGGRIGGSARSMGDIQRPGINPSAATRRAGRLGQRAEKATDTAAQTTPQVNNPVATDAAGGLTTAAGANAGHDGHTGSAALGNTAGLGTSAAGSIDTAAARGAAADTAGQAVDEARSGMSATRSGTEQALGRTQDAAGNASANIGGAANAGLNTAQQASAVGTQSAATAGSLGTDAAGKASQATAAESDATSNGTSGDTTTAKPGLLSRMRNAFGGTRHAAVGGSASGGASGNAGESTTPATSTIPGTKVISGNAQGSGNANGQASAHGSANDGFSTSVQAGGNANAAANAQEH